MLPATVLTFNLPVDVHARIRGLAVALGIRVKAVPPESFATPLGAMLGIPTTGPTDIRTEAGGFSDPMLLMCNLNEAQFNRFLQLLRGPGLSRIPLKAVLTPYNVGWNALQLHAELSREHEAITRGRGT